MLSCPPRPAPLTRPPGTPIVWSTDLPLMQGPMTSRPSVSLPAIEAVRPTLSNDSISSTLSQFITKHKSVVKDVGATKWQKTKGGKSVLVVSSIPPLEEEEIIGPLTKAAALSTPSLYPSWLCKVLLGVTLVLRWRPWVNMLRFNSRICKARHWNLQRWSVQRSWLSQHCQIASQRLKENWQG